MLKFFDARVFVGRRGNVPPGSAANTKEVMAILSQCGIEKAVCCHSVSVEGDPFEGNGLLSGELRGTSGMARQWVAMPDTLGDFPKPDALLAMMKSANVTSLRLLPKTLCHSLLPYTAKPLMDALCACRIPVFLDLAETNWDQLYAFCSDFPENPVVLTEPDYRGIRYIDPMLAVCKNLFIGTSNLVAFEALPRLCKKHGAKRFLFESGTPRHSAASSVSNVLYAEISDEEKALIAGENLHALLGEVSL